MKSSAVTTPKRHHYVPRFILANFANGEGKLWIRRTDGENIWRAAPEEIFVEQHRHSLIDEQGKRNPELEKAYAVLEGDTKPIVDKFIEADLSQVPRRDCSRWRAAIR